MPDSHRQAKRRNLGLLCAFRAGQMSLFPIAVIALFWKQHVGLSMMQIMVLEGIFGVAVALFEFPSGYLADRMGYRWTLVLAALLNVAAWSIYLVGSTFAWVMAAEILAGIGLSLSSGTDAAMLYESLKDLDAEEDFALWNGRVRFWGQAAEGTAALAAGVLYVWWPRLPFMLVVGVWLVNAVVAWQLCEPTRARPARHGHWRQLRGIWRYVLLESPGLRAIMALGIVLGMSSFVPVWLIPLYATGAGVPTAWIGVVWAAANYMVAIGALLSHRLRAALGVMPTLFVCLLLVAGGYLGLGLSHGRFGFAFYFLLTLMRGLNGPILLHEEQRLIPSENRAGTLSLRSLLFRVFFVFVGPAVGLAVDRTGQHRVFLVLGLALSLLGTGAWLAVRRLRLSTRAIGEDKKRTPG